MVKILLFNIQKNHKVEDTFASKIVLLRKRILCPSFGLIMTYYFCLLAPSSSKFRLYCVNYPCLFKALCNMREELCPVPGTPWPLKTLQSDYKVWYVGFPGSLLLKE